MRLNMDLLQNNEVLAKKMRYDQSFSQLPERIIQFGEGNFLRAFSDWMIQQLNDKGLFNGRIVAVQPIAHGLSEEINKQDGLYTLFIRGMQDGKKVNNASVMSCISRCINPYAEWEEYIKCAENPDIRYVISNTTEAGIVYNSLDNLEDKPATSFPGKLTQYLYHRYCHFNGSPESGMVIFACELIERNGDELKKIVLQLADDWELSEDFKTWLNEHNYFLTTLVDRIVPGYPRDEVQQLTEQLGYEDKIMCTAECFYLWVIEGPSKLRNCIPFKEAGLNVLWTDDVYPYKTRKVRILNGTHIATVPVGLLYGIDTVGECIDHEVIGKFMKHTMHEEIVPSIERIDRGMLEEFAASIEDRFKNPYIKHNLLSISLNGISKFKERIIPSILGYKKLTGDIPENLAFSLATMIAFYQGYRIEDNKLIVQRDKGEYQIVDEIDILEFFKEVWLAYKSSNKTVKDIVKAVLENTRLWDMNLIEVEGLYEKVCTNLESILEVGVKNAILKLDSMQ